VVQLEDWRQRQAEYHQALADFDAKIASTASLIVKAKEDKRNYEQELGIAQDVENRYTDLERQGFGAHVKTLGAVTARVETARLLAEAKNQAIQSSHDLDDLKYQRQVYMHQWQDTIATALVTARTSLNDSLDNQVKATRSRELSDIVAPQDAIVVQIGNYSPGSVADPNAQSSPGTPPLFTLVPLNGKVEAEVDVDAKDQGFVKAGDKVRIKFDAYRFIQHGTADGVVKSMSEGSFTMDRNQQPVPPYFKARVVFTNVKLRNVPSDFRLIPGMTLVGDIVIGHRTIMSYLVEGALRTGSEAMREPQ